MRGSPPLAQHVLVRLRSAAAATAALLTLSLLPIVVAGAEPVPPGGEVAVDAPAPGSAAQAQAAWLAAEERAEHLNEQLVQAGIDVDTATAAQTAAAAQTVAATAAVAESAAAGAAAQAVVDEYAVQLEQFAAATFRGARTSSLTSLLTANSPDAYLDSVVALDRVAASNNDLLEQARAAKTTADNAGAELAAAQAAAVEQQQTAAAARDAAVGAQTELTATQADFDARVAEYETLYNQLTEQERLAAFAAEEQRLADAAAAAAAAAPDDADAAVVADSLTLEAGTPAVTAAPARAAAGAVTGPLAPAPNAAAQVAVEAALSKVGSKYVWGAAGPNQFDCSGLTSWAWKQAGITIPRTSSTQAGLPVVPLDQLQPGDLITFYSPVSHVAMYIGNGQMVQASTASKPVYVTSIAKGGPNPVGHRVG